MLDIKFIRDIIDLVKEAARKKHITVDLDRLVELDEKRKSMMVDIEAKRAEQNAASEKITNATQSERDVLIGSMKTLKDALAKEEEKLKPVMQEWHTLMVQVPNVPDITVPDGESDADNQEIRTVGDIP